MKIIKIGAVWCSGCLVMNRVFKKVLEKYDFDVVELDYDLDEIEVSKYNPGDILPVFIFFDGKEEIGRIIGEVSYEKFIEKVEGFINR